MRSAPRLLPFSCGSDRPSRNIRPGLRHSKVAGGSDEIVSRARVWFVDSGRRQCRASGKARLDTGCGQEDRRSGGDPHPFLIVTSRVADHSLWAEVLNLGGYDVLAHRLTEKRWP